MAVNKPLKISYCTTCKGRLHHLKQTLPANMAAEKDNPNVEFVVLDYGSEDGLANWIKENFQNEMQSGRLRYARYESEHFQYAHSRNMAHRLATGDVLCNVDADNYITPDFSQWLRDVFERKATSIVTVLPVTLTKQIVRNVGAHLGGWRFQYPSAIGGRVAVMANEFANLGGYDEHISGWGGEDKDFAQRAHSSGLGVISLPRGLWGSSIAHSNDERLANLAPHDRAHSQAKMTATPEQNRRGDLRAAMQKLKPAPNADGNVGCGTVYINFSAEPTVIGPLKPAVAREAAPANELAPVTEAGATRRTDWAQSAKAGSMAAITHRGR